MVGGTIRRKMIHRESFRASVLRLSEIRAVLETIALKKCLLTTPRSYRGAPEIVTARRGCRSPCPSNQERSVVRSGSATY